MPTPNGTLTFVVTWVDEAGVPQSSSASFPSACTVRPARAFWQPFDPAVAVAVEGVVPDAVPVYPPTLIAPAWPVTARSRARTGGTRLMSSRVHIPATAYRRRLKHRGEGRHALGGGSTRKGTLTGLPVPPITNS